MDVGRGVYETNNQPKKATFKYNQEQWLCIVVAKVEIKEDGTITGNRFPVLGYTEKKISTVEAYKKWNPKWIRKNEESYFVVVTMGRKN